jgi:hypothetical protein
MDNQKDNSLLPIGPPSVIPKLVRDKVENYRIVDIANEKIDKLHKLIYEILDDTYGIIYKCNQYDLIDGIKDYCENYVTDLEDNDEIYQCDNCNDYYCYLHAKAKDWKQSKKNMNIICNECYKSRIKCYMHICNEECNGTTVYDKPDDYNDYNIP